MREAIFITEIKDSLEQIGIGAYKPADLPMSWIGGSKMRFVPEKPADLICDNFGVYTLIECKQIKKWQGVSMRLLRPAQIKALNGVVERSHLGGAFVFFNIRIKNDKANGIKGENLCMVLSWRHNKEALEKGIGIKEMRAKAVGMWIEARKGKEAEEKGKFDLRWLLEENYERQFDQRIKR